MASIDDGNKSKRKCWLDPMDRANLAGLSEKDKRIAQSFVLWLLIWGAMFFNIVLGMEPLPGGIDATPVWRLLLVFSPIIASIFLVRAFVRLIRELKDELIKKMHFEALAVGFLIAFFLGMCFDLSAVIIGGSLKAGPLMFAGLIGGYFVALILSYRKYNV